MENKKFREMNHEERLQYLKTEKHLEDKEINFFRNTGALEFDTVNGMVENAIGIFPLPIGLANNFVINNKEYIIPMATEEPSVIAASSNAAKIAKISGGFVASADESIMIGQIQLILEDSSGNIGIENAIKLIQDSKNEIITIANTKSKSAKCMDLKARIVSDDSINKLGQMIIVEIFVDTKDAMGANVVNTMCEAVAPKIEDITGGKIILKILSNYTTERLARCKGTFSKDAIGGEEIIKRILFSYSMAYSDTYRAVTHNKGIMNGIDSVSIATGQDFRAIEAGCHAYACKDGKYRSLTKWYQDSNGDLVGEIEIPIAVGTVGGITNTHPIVKTCLKIMDISNSKELAMLIAASGLAQNFSAIRALSNEGIQKGHMKLHSKNIALMAGATDEKIEQISIKMISEGNISVSRAKEILETIDQSKNTD